MNHRERRIKELELEHLAATPWVERLAAYAECSPRELIAEAYRVQYIVGDAPLEEACRILAAREGIDADEMLAHVRRIEQEAQP